MTDPNHKLRSLDKDAALIRRLRGDGGDSVRGAKAGEGARGTDEGEGEAVLEGEGGRRRTKGSKADKVSVVYLPVLPMTGGKAGEGTMIMFGAPIQARTPVSESHGVDTEDLPGEHSRVPVTKENADLAIKNIYNIHNSKLHYLVSYAYNIDKNGKSTAKSHSQQKKDGK